MLYGAAASNIPSVQHQVGFQSSLKPQHGNVVSGVFSKIQIAKPIKREFSEVKSKELTNILRPKRIKREFSEVKQLDPSGVCKQTSLRVIKHSEDFKRVDEICGIESVIYVS